MRTDRNDVSEWENTRNQNIFVYLLHTNAHTRVHTPYTQHQIEKLQTMNINLVERLSL